MQSGMKGPHGLLTELLAYVAVAITAAVVPVLLFDDVPASPVFSASYVTHP